MTDIVKIVHEHDGLMRRARHLAALAKRVDDRNAEFGVRDVFGAPSEKKFMPFTVTDQHAIAALARAQSNRLQEEASALIAPYEQDARATTENDSATRDENGRRSRSLFGRLWDRGGTR